MSYYTEAEHTGCCASALSDLALATGQAQPDAVKRHEEAIAGYGDDYARSRAHATTQLATVVMATGDPDQAAALGASALAATGPILSARNGDYLRVLHKVAEPHAGRPAIEELRAQIAATLAA